MKCKDWKESGWQATSQKLEEVQKMQLKQAEFMEKMEERQRGLEQSQSSGSKPAQHGLQQSPKEKDEKK